MVALGDDQVAAALQLDPVEAVELSCLPDDVAVAGDAEELLGREAEDGDAGDDEEDDEEGEEAVAPLGAQLFLYIDLLGPLGSGVFMKPLRYLGKICSFLMRIFYCSSCSTSWTMLLSIHLLAGRSL